MKQDFLPCSRGEMFFFTEELADSFIHMAVDACVRELEALRTCGAGLDEYLWAWKDKPCRLLETTLYYITPEFTVLHWLNVYGWRYVVRLLGNFNC